MRTLRFGFILALLIALIPGSGRAQTSDDISEMDQWIKDTQNQGTLPPGTKITMANWQQYKTFMPLGMQKLFEGTYGWKMPADVEIDVGPTHMGNLTKNYVEATEKYGSQDTVTVLPNGHMQINNYQGGLVFPNPQEPHKGFKILANLFFDYVPALYVNTPANYGTCWVQDRFNNISAETFDVVYRQSGWNTDPGFPKDLDYAPGTWYTEWGMQETPEQARYTASLSLFYKDQETHTYPDTFVFVPALRRSLRLSSSARCSPVFGLDWTYDDAKGNGFNGGTALFDAKWLGDRKVIGLMMFNADGAIFPQNYFMPLGFPKPSWGSWEVRDSSVIDAQRIQQEAAGYCYGDRVMYIEKEGYWALWSDLYDSNHKLWKLQFWGPELRDDVPELGRTLGGVTAISWDMQNTHATYWAGMGNPWKRLPYIDSQVPVQYRDGAKYGSPSGLMQILR